MFREVAEGFCLNLNSHYCESDKFFKIAFEQRQMMTKAKAAGFTASRWDCQQERIEFMNRPKWANIFMYVKGKILKMTIFQIAEIKQH